VAHEELAFRLFEHDQSCGVVTERRIQEWCAEVSGVFELVLPPVSGMSLQSDGVGDESVSGTFTNPYQAPIPSDANIYVVYIGPQGNVVGGASETADSSRAWSLRRLRVQRFEQLDQRILCPIIFRVDCSVVSRSLRQFLFVSGSSACIWIAALDSYTDPVGSLTLNRPTVPVASRRCGRRLPELEQESRAQISLTTRSTSKSRLNLSK
jgi:hypothetical protein